MAYLGRGIENLSDRVVLDSLTASATASYTLQLNSVNFVPSSASSLTVSLNGVIQKPDSSYTVSGSTLTFSSALTSSDSIDFIIAERGITLQTPSAGSVNTEQLAANAVNNSKIASDAAIATTKLGTGAVLQVVSFVSNTQITTTANFGSTGNATGIKASITPSSTSSKIFINSTGSFKLELDGTTTNKIGLFGIKDNTGSSLLYKTRVGAQLSATNKDFYGNISMNFLHSPNTTSSREYEITFGRFNSSFNNTIFINGDTSSYHSSITLMEIAG